MLDLCLDRINQLGESGSISVTLLISSTVISGDLIHPMIYLKAIQTAISQKYGPIIDNAEKADVLRSYKKETIEIFLENIEIWKPIPQDKIDGPIAINIDAIDGFIFGRLDLSIKVPKLQQPVTPPLPSLRI